MSPSVLGVLAVVGTMVIAALGTRNTWRPIKGRAATTATWALLALGGLTLLAVLAVVILIAIAG